MSERKRTSIDAYGGLDAVAAAAGAAPIERRPAYLLTGPSRHGNAASPLSKQH